MKKLSFSHYLFFSVIAIYCVFVTSFLYYQYHREKTHKVEMLNSTLTMFNAFLYEHLSDSTIDVGECVRQYGDRRHLYNLRVTLIDRSGKVLYDNDIEAKDVKENHLDREEIQQALVEGNGYSIKRESATLEEPFFYSASYFPDKKLFIRSALPYDTDLIAMLNADKGYLWFSFLLSAILFLVFYNLTARLGAMITQLRVFASRADQDETMDMDDLKGLGNTDLGQISRHIENRNFAFADNIGYTRNNHTSQPFGNIGSFIRRYRSRQFFHKKESVGNFESISPERAHSHRAVICVPYDNRIFRTPALIGKLFCINEKDIGLKRRFKSVLPGHQFGKQRHVIGIESIKPR